MSVRPDDLTDILAALTLFADCTETQLEAATHAFEEMWFNPGERIIREGFSQPEFHLIIQGEASVRVNGEERALLGSGEFFGEISALLDEPPTADVVATSPLRCLVLTAKELNKLLLAYPVVMFRMLQTEARRLRDANQWRT